MSSDPNDLNLPIPIGSSLPRMQLSGQQYVRWWMSNLEKLAANGQLQEMLRDRQRRRQPGVPFVWHD